MVTSLIKISILSFMLVSSSLTPFKQAEVNQFSLVQIEDSYDFHSDKQQEYLSRSNHLDISGIAGGVEELSKPKDLTISFTDSNPNNYHLEKYYVYLSESALFNPTRVKETLDNYVNFNNLKLGTRYYYKVAGLYTEGRVESNTLSFTTTNVGPRNINVDGVTNVRDIGGKLIDDHHRIKQGLIYRNGRLNVSWKQATINQFTEEGYITLKEELGIKTEIDLRKVRDGEYSHISTSALGRNTNYINCPMEYNTTIFLLDNKDMIRAAFNILTNPSYYPISFHCDIGTDRTGVLGYLILGLLGVSQKDIEIDYLFSNFGNIGSSRSINSINSSMNQLNYYLGDTLQKKIKDYLITIGVKEYKLNNFINNMIETI